jgi:hypothetical protein
MGAWGYSPLQNDTAADWLGDIGDYCSQRVAQVFAQDFNKYEAEEIRAACLLLERLGESYLWPPQILQTQLKQGIAFLVELRDDEEWAAEWQEPNEIRNALQEQITALKQRLSPPKPALDTPGETA